MPSVRDYRALVAEERELREYSPDEADKIAGQIRLLDMAIERLEPEERRLIRMRYVFGWKWQKIEMKMHYSRTEIFRRHRKAIAELAEYGR